MEKNVVASLAESVAAGECVALVSVISNSGSSPAKCGAVMLVNNLGALCGTVGGGSLELKVVGQARECIRLGRSQEVEYSLAEGGDLGMSCGGKVHCFIKVFSAQPRLIIVGGGHVGMELYHLGILQGYRVEIFDDRESIVTPDRFPDAGCLVYGDPVTKLSECEIDSNCYVAIATHSHDLDMRVVAAVAESGAGYVGMIGSTSKIKKTLQFLLERGIARETIEKVYAPMGLNVATIQPKEIAISIMSEILLVKNSGSPEHMKSVKKITF